MEMLEYKEELQKDYSTLIKKSLLFSLEQYVKTEVIDLDTYMFLSDDHHTLEQVKDYLMEKEDFLKTKAELEEEMEIIRKDFHALMTTEEDMPNLVSKSFVDATEIVYLQHYYIDEHFIMSYFGVEESELIRLMKRKGFAEKFSVLRLTAIFQPFIEKKKEALIPWGFEENVIMDLSYVYANEEIGYGRYTIDVLFKINADFLEEMKNKQDFALFVSTTFKEADTLFIEKTKA